MAILSVVCLLDIKLDWCSPTKSLITLFTLFAMTLVIILINTLLRQIRWNCDISYRCCCLGYKHTMDLFISIGTLPFLNIFKTKLATNLSSQFQNLWKKLVGILSGPGALWASKLNAIILTSYSVNSLFSHDFAFLLRWRKFQSLRLYVTESSLMYKLT